MYFDSVMLVEEEVSIRSNNVHLDKYILVCY